jgi:GNAT superfamily N-acetyltransferase
VKRPDDAGRMAEGLPAAWETLVRAINGGTVERVDGLVLTLTNLPDPQLNSAFVERAPEDPGAALAAASQVFADHDQRLGIDLPRGWYPDLERAAAELGMELVVSRPGMTAPVAAIAPAAPPSGVELLPVAGERDLEEFWEIQAIVFEMKPEVVRGYVGIGALGSPGVALFLARSEGTAVASSVSITSDGAVGIFGISTLPEARGRGIGAAVTAAAIDAVRGEADLAWLQASEEGEGVYRRMGFRPVVDWDVLVLS